MEGQIYTVSEVNGFIKNVIDGIPQLSGIYIRGELSNYKIYPSGHHYFTLKDSEGALRCVMFRGDAQSLRFRPENGMQVVAAGRITVFPRDGQYQMYCVHKVFQISAYLAGGQDGTLSRHTCPPSLHARQVRIAVPIALSVANWGWAKMA